MYNLTLWRVCLITVAAQTQQCILCLFHNFINGKIFGQKFVGGKTVLLFSPQILSETFFILRRIQSDSIINVHRS
jgi:hypothetical protein